MNSHPHDLLPNNPHADRCAGFVIAVIAATVLWVVAIIQISLLIFLRFMDSIQRNNSIDWILTFGFVSAALFATGCSLLAMGRLERLTRPPTEKDV